MRHIIKLTANLSCEAAAQVHGTRAGLVCLEPQHDSGGEFIVSIASAGLLLFMSHTETLSQNFAFKLPVVREQKD